MYKIASHYNLNGREVFEFENLPETRVKINFRTYPNVWEVYGGDFYKYGLFYHDERHGGEVVELNDRCETVPEVVKLALKQVGINEIEIYNS